MAVIADSRARADQVAVARPRRKIDWGNQAAYVILSVWMVFTLFPVAWLLVSSLKEPQDVFAMPPQWVFVPTLHNYEVVLGFKIPTELETVTEAQAGTGTSQFPRFLLNTAVIAIGTTVLALSIGSAAAYALTRFYPRQRNALLIGVLVTRLVPPVVLIIPIYVIWRNFDLLDTHFGLMLAYLTFALPFVIWMMRGFLLDIPVELEEAAMIDGASRFQALIRVVLPLAAPGLAATAIFVILLAWNDFFYALILTSGNARTVTPYIGGFITDKAILWGRLYASSAIIMLPVLIFGLVVQKQLAHGLTGGAVKG
ncbi:MAG: carbohydrate ABC transporter permease [Chloroflexi bacterium]|nr:carbohydrate ABC transporter permease [Chloroflexota bacterium]